MVEEIEQRRIIQYFLFLISCFLVYNVIKFREKSKTGVDNANISLLIHAKDAANIININLTFEISLPVTKDSVAVSNAKKRANG